MKKIVSLLLATAVILTGNTLSVHAETKQEKLPDSEVVEEFNVFNTDVIETTEEIPDIQTRSHITYKVTRLNQTSEIGAYSAFYYILGVVNYVLFTIIATPLLTPFL